MSDINCINKELNTSDIILLCFNIIGFFISFIGLFKCVNILNNCNKYKYLKKKYDHKWFNVTEFKNMFNGIKDINEFKYKLYINKNNANDIKNNTDCVYVFNYFNDFELCDDFKTDEELKDIKKSAIYDDKSHIYTIFKYKIKKWYKKNNLSGNGDIFNIYLSKKYILIEKKN